MADVRGPADHLPAWARPERPARPPGPALSRALIVEAGIRITDAEGLEGLTMRRVAAELNAGTMSLYKHVSSKEDLLDLMLDAVTGQAAVTEPFDGWRAGMRQFAMNGRRNFLAHPWALTVASARPSLGPNVIQQLDTALGLLAGLKLTMTEVNNLVSAVYAYVVGYTLPELAEREAQRRTGVDHEQYRKAIAAYVRGVVESGHYPSYARVIREGDELGADERFEFGLDRVLDGIAAYLDGRD